MSILLDLLKNSIKYWYIPLAVGIIQILTGSLFFYSPDGTFVVLSFLFAASFLLSGVLEIVFAVANRQNLTNWGWFLVFGLTTLLTGALLLSNPGVSMLTLSLYVGFLVMFRSIVAMTLAFEVKEVSKGSWIWLLLFGMMGAAISFILLWNPGLAGLTLIFWLGLGIISNGAYNVLFSFRLKKLKNLKDNPPQELKDNYNELVREIEKLK